VLLLTMLPPASSSHGDARTAPSAAGTRAKLKASPRRLPARARGSAFSATITPGSMRRSPAFVASAPALLDAERIALADPGGASDVPLLGRPDWWALWHRARGSACTPPPGSFGTTLSAEYLRHRRCRGWAWHRHRLACS
jgi:hypothetical protein